MITYTSADIQNLEKRFRTTFINGLSGFKSANLIGTKSAKGQENLAIFSSGFHLGSDPGLLGFITRPVSVDRHTYSNIVETGFFTVNHVADSFKEKAHRTLARFDEAVSEFESCGLKPTYLEGFHAPFVVESPIKIACKLVEEIPVKTNDTILLVGKILAVHLQEGILEEDGFLNLAAAEVVSISALDGYHRAAPPTRFKYAKPDKATEKI